eukprot:scaffold1985_cov134-Pinguiococcus_pyrenoidosus.AAC.1
MAKGFVFFTCGALFSLSCVPFSASFRTYASGLRCAKSLPESSKLLPGGLRRQQVRRWVASQISLRVVVPSIP